MKVKVLVIVDIDAIDDGSILPDDLHAAAVEAVNDSVEFGQQTGFNHALAEVATIGVVSVEEVVSKRVMTTFLTNATVIDPDSGRLASVALRKLESGEIVGVDWRYEQEYLNNPYSEGKIVLPEDESYSWAAMWV